jgi:hypothetical protein
MVSASSRRRSVRRTAAKLEAAIFWKMAMREAKRLALAALALGEVEAVLQVGLQAFVEGALAIAHDEALSMHEAAGEERRAVGLAGVGLGAPEDYRIQSMTLLDHFLGAVEQRRV